MNDVTPTQADSMLTLLQSHPGAFRLGLIRLRASGSTEITRNKEAAVSLIYGFTGPIGKNAVNRVEDVWLFQLIVNALPASIRGTPALLPTDGKMGASTMNALLSIQKQGARVVDGVLTPGGTTQRWMEAQLRLVKLPVYKVPLPVPPVSPASTSGQSNWRWCSKCQGLWFAGNAPGVCKAGGGHSSIGSGNYVVLTGSGSGQSGWRWCSKCQGLWFSGGATAGSCPAGAAHSSAGSGLYRADGFAGKGQNNWRWCSVCAGMFFAGGGSSGKCPGKWNAGHDSTGSGDYALVQK